MQAVIFIGIQACGKSRFYKENFIDTHIRINLDMLKTRNRENIILSACIEAKQPFVIDNTNPTILSRCLYIEKAKKAKFQIVGYYFESKISDALKRNNNRIGISKLDEKAILSTHKKLEIPSYLEEFNSLWYVKILDGKFIVEEWKDEV